MEKDGPIHNESTEKSLEDLQKVTTVDTIHNDEALKVLARHAGDETWTAQEGKKLQRKIDRRLLSILCITYGLQYYDKAMLSQAAIFGLRKDLELEVGNRYSMSASIFYLGFIVGAYPAILLAQRYPIERVASGIVCIWGGVLMCTAACHSYQALYAQRFFLGFIESGISPMFMIVVGGWYKKQEQALRMGAWYCCTGYVSIISPLINYGLGHITGGSLASWQYMAEILLAGMRAYLVAGCITILWSVAIFFLLPADPIRAKGFSERERYIAVARMRQNNSGVRNTHFKKEQVFEAVTDIKFWIVFFTAFFQFWANGPVSSFIPIIIAGFGFNTLNSLLLVMPAGFMSGTTELLAPFIASKRSDRGPGLSSGGLLFGCYILASFGGGYAVLMGLQIANTAGYTKRSVTSSGIFMGYCFGNFVGPLLFKEKDAPGYAPGFEAVLGSAIATLVLTIIYRYVCLWENKKRDKTGVEAFDHAFEDDITDRKNPQFRYTT